MKKENKFVAVVGLDNIPCCFMRLQDSGEILIYGFVDGEEEEERSYAPDVVAIIPKGHIVKLTIRSKVVAPGSSTREGILVRAISSGGKFIDSVIVSGLTEEETGYMSYAITGLLQKIPALQSKNQKS